MDAKRIVVLEGDETGQELLEQALRVLAPDVIGLELELPRFDLSLESRRATENAGTLRDLSPWARNAQQSGGFALESGVHEVDTVRFLLDHGVLLSTTGLGCLSTPIGDAELEGFLEVFAQGLAADRRG